MAGKYEITNVTMGESDDSSIPRNVTLKVNGRTLDRISKCVERTTDLRTLENKRTGKVLNECYIDLSLDKLRELDSNRDAQDRFISNRSRFLDKGMINVLMVKLRLQNEQKLDNLDYEYLNSLLSWPYNDIYVMPMLEFEDVQRIGRVEIYNEFVKNMLKEKSSWIKDDVNIGLSIPHIYPRRNIRDLFELYSEEKPTFIAIDFNNSRMNKPSDITGTVLKYFNGIKEEKFFMYGVNVKPYKRGIQNTAAWDIYMVHGSFNAIGPTHSKPRPIVLPGDWNSIGRIFDSKQIKYTGVDEDHLIQFIEWVDENYGIEINKDYKNNDKSLYPYLKRYNFQESNNVLKNYSKAIDEGDTSYLKNMREVMPEEMKNVKLMQEKRRTRRSDKKSTS